MVLSNFYHSGKYLSDKYKCVQYFQENQIGHAEQSSTYYLHTSPILSKHPQPPLLKKESERASLFSINWYF